MGYIGIKTWDELEERMFRSEWLGAVLILAFLIAVAVGLTLGA